MSNEDVGRFVEYIASDARVADGLVNVVATNPGDAAYEAVSVFAQGHGFDINVEDAQVLQKTLLQVRDLSDDELDGVVGGAVLEVVGAVGVLGGVVAITVGIGVAGTAVNAIANAVEGKAWNSRDNSVAKFMGGFNNFMMAW